MVMKASDANWTLHWESPQCTHPYEPLYLGNTNFGSMLDLTGTDMSLWDSRIGGLQENPREEHEGILFPVTALRTQVHYRNEHYRKEGFWMSNAAILSDRPEYIQHPAMPQRAQIYKNVQSLRLKDGTATTSGVVFPGSYSSLQTGLYKERAIDFKTAVAFLKDAPVMGMWIEVEDGTDVLFDPTPVLEDDYKLKNSGQSIYSLGNEIDENVCVRQEQLSCAASGNTITYRFKPTGGAAYTVSIRGAGAEIVDVKGRPSLQKRGSLFVTISILRDSQVSSDANELWTKEAFFAEQTKRWVTFWNRSEVNFPPEESEWQQRYRISLFYVAQSLNDAPCHPVGLSKPMIPYWFGSFHDTDTYFCRPLLEAGHGEQALKYLNYRHRTLAKAYEVAKEMNLPGAMYPWQSDPVGNGERRDTPINHGIIAAEAWHHFAHTGSDDALKKVYDILEGIIVNLMHNVDESQPQLRLKDEYHNTFSETIRAKQPGEVVLALRITAERYLKACELLEKETPALATCARRILDELELTLAGDGSYRIYADDDPEYMRCPSITLGSFPLHCLDADEAMEKTYDKELSCVVSIFSWMPQLFSIIGSQLERSSGMNNAWQVLNDSMVHDKTWFAVDEWENRRTVRPKIFVTCAGGNCSAIHAMMIAETGVDEWTVFPGCPDDWRQASFRDLCTRAGWRVSAAMENGEVVSLSFTPHHEYAQRGLSLRVPRASEAIRIEGCYAARKILNGVLTLEL